MFAKTGSDRVLSELENLFRTLALESKKTHSHLKHATEKAIMKLREYRNLNKSMSELKYVLSNDVILRPLILSWSSKHISISLTALNILQKLLNVNCISSDSFMQILISLRTLLTLQTNYRSSSSQSQWSNLDINIQIKMCQILIQIPASSSWTVSRPFLQHIVYITLLLCQSEETAVRSTSLAALQQIATVALEYSVNSDRYNAHHRPSIDDDSQPPSSDAHDARSDTEPMYIFECLFHDLCCLASPKLLYLNKQIISSHHTPSEKEKEKEKNVNEIKNTAVAFSNIELKQNNDAKEVKDNDDAMDDDIEFIESNSWNPHHLAHVSELERDNNLSTLRLLDCDFEIDYVPILQLLETLIANKEYFGSALKISSGLLHILQEQLCPLMCEMIRDHTLPSFEGMIRIGRLIIELLSRHYVYLEIETDLILSALLRLLEINNDFPHWAPIIILEILRHLLKNSFLLKFFYIKYDMNSNSDKRVFGSLIHGLGRFLHQTTSNKAKITSLWSPKRLDNKYFSFIKDIRAPPTEYDASLQVTLAVLSLISFTEGLAVVCSVSSSLSPAASSPLSSSLGLDPPSPVLAPSASIKSTMYPPRSAHAEEEQEAHDIMSNEHDITLDVSRDIARHMVEVVWRPLLAALSHMLNHSVEEAQYQQLLSIYQTTARICGRIQLIKPLERLLSSMSEHGLPHPFFNYTFSDILFNLSANKDMLDNNDVNNSGAINLIGASGSASSSSSDSLHNEDHVAESGSISPQIGGNISFIQQADANEADAIKLSIKNVCTIHALVNIAHGLGSILGSAWSVLLETFEKLDYIFHRQNIQLVDISSNIISPDSHWNDEVNMLDSRLQQLFDSTEYLDDKSLCELLAALGHLSSSSLAGLATTLDKKVPDSSASSQRLHQRLNKNQTTSILSNDDAISVDKVKSFALRKFVQTIEVNIHRLNKIWDHVIAHLHVIMNFKNSTLRHFGIKTLIRIQLKVLNDGNNEADEFQKRLFSPYLKLFRSKYGDTRERVIRAVSELLENAGDKITHGWPVIVELLNYVPSTENNHSVTVTCLKLAFDDVRLISSDFMECLPDFCILGLIKTVGLFGKQRFDNNISYSSIGLLWKISDHITLITKKKDNNENNKLIVIADGLQIAIFKQLQVLCVDGRSDVRNCAMQTINSALVAYGDRLELSKWMECIKILVVLLTDVVVARTRLNQQQDAQKREQLTKREYRAFKKKWNETEKHCIRGASRICKMFIAKLHKEEEFRSYWTYYLETIIKLLDLNVEVASTGIQCLQDIAQSTDFIDCCHKNTRYWTEIINCYESMIRNVGHKEYELITAAAAENKSAETYACELPFAEVCDAMMESIKDLLNPEMASRKLFNLTQIEKLISNLDFLISDKNLENNLKYQSLEILDARLVRLKKLLAIYQQLPPLAPSIARPIISRIASYLSYVSKCCHCYHNYRTKEELSLSEKSLLRKTEKTMDFVSAKAITLLNQFYSIHIASSLKVECFEIVLNGISQIMNPFLCPIAVVTNAITGFQDVCKTGLPQFSANADKLSSVESLRVWSVLGDVVSIAFRLQHHTVFNKPQQQKQHEMNKKLQKLIELKLSILETTMQHILPFGHLAPLSLKKRIVMLLNTHCSYDDDDDTIPERHSRLSDACITAMFSLCCNESSNYDVALSTMSYQLLIPKIAFILDKYIDDEMSRVSNRPLPIYRQKHIVTILNHCGALKIDPRAALDSADSYFSVANSRKIKEKKSLPIKSSKRPHLFRLYPVLCKLIRVKDEQIKNSLCKVFKVFGDEMGLN